MTTHLVIGQNTAINLNLAYQLSIDAQGWQVNALVKKSGAYTSLNDEAGLGLVDQSLFLNLQDADNTLEEVIVYCERQATAAPTMTAVLTVSLTGETIVTCASGHIDPCLQALEVVHIYLRNGQWKIKSFFQGYKGGKQALLQTKSITQNISTSTSTDTIAPTAPAAGAKLAVKLSWSISSNEHFDTSTAYIGSEFSALSSLNFFCLYILKSGQRGVVYAPDENAQGSLEGIPFCKPQNNADKGECELIFNSAYSHKMFKYIICAEITEGSRCWKDTNVLLEASIDEQKTQCAIDSELHTPFYVFGIIEVLNGTTSLKRIDKYFHTPADIASAVGFSRA
jgi:uncharacterized protein involved in tellurium resistance